MPLFEASSGDWRQDSLLPRCQKQGRQHQMDGFPGIKRLLSRWLGDTIVIAALSIPPLILKTKFSGGRGRE